MQFSSSPTETETKTDEVRTALFLLELHLYQIARPLAYAMWRSKSPDTTCVPTTTRQDGAKPPQGRHHFLLRETKIHLAEETDVIC